MCEQSEGAKLKARRLRLGKDEAWIEAALDASPISRTDGTYGMRGNGYGSARRIAAEGGDGDYYSDRQRGELIKAYRAALEAEEARQAAESAQAEPVCPEGVTNQPFDLDGDARIGMERGYGYVIYVSPCGTIHKTSVAGPVSPALLRYAADLSDYRARKHAEGDRQRKLDAVRAAEEALRLAGDAPPNVADCRVMVEVDGSLSFRVGATVATISRSSLSSGNLAWVGGMWTSPEQARFIAEYAKWTADTHQLRAALDTARREAGL